MYAVLWDLRDAPDAMTRTMAADRADREALRFLRMVASTLLPAVGLTLWRYDAARGRAAGEIGIYAVGMEHKGSEYRVKPCLDRGTQVGKRVYMPHVRLRPCRACLFNVLKLRRFGVEIKTSQIGAVHDGIRPVDPDILQAEAGGLYRHKSAGQLDGGVAAAALNIVGTETCRLRYTGKIR